jgi:hypothetical protein
MRQMGILRESVVVLVALDVAVGDGVCRGAGPTTADADLS